jgi:hypothetical protein
MEGSMSKDQTRRNFVGVAGITAATVATAALLRPASAQTAAAVPKMEYAIKKLPFDPAKIKGISEKLLVSHFENNYSGAVKRLNAITAQLAGLDVAAAPVFVVNGLKREERLWKCRALEGRIFRRGQGAGRWFRLGDAELFTARQATRQYMGG